MPNFQNTGPSIEDLKEQLRAQIDDNPVEQKAHWEQIKLMVDSNLRGGAPSTPEAIQAWQETCKEIDEMFSERGL